MKSDLEISAVFTSVCIHTFYKELNYILTLKADVFLDLFCNFAALIWNGFRFLFVALHLHLEIECEGRHG